MEEAERAGLGLIEAVELMLRNDPNIFLAEALVDSAQGALLRARGSFDPLLSADLDQIESKAPAGGSSAGETATIESSISLVQLLRSGLELTPAVELEQTDSIGPAVNSATVLFTLRQPLLRGRGRETVAAQELATDREAEASRLDLEHRIAERALAVALQYWTLKAAMLDLEILRATERSSRELLETTRRLVAADITPAAEIVQLEADLASRQANRIAGESTLFQARQDLGREIGLEPAMITELRWPADPFPEIEPDRVPMPDDSASLVVLAMARRADLRAGQERLIASEIRLKAADNALRPQLDLVFTPSYTGLTEGSGAGELFAPLFQNVPGLSTSMGLRLLWPTRNRDAEGVRLQSAAAVRLSDQQVELTVKEIGAGVPAALDAVRRNAQQLIKINEAIELFERALENEIKKLRAGSSTLIDVITQRDRLTSAQQRRVSARLALASAVLDLRFQTGTLVTPGGEVRSISREQLTTLPF